MEKIETKIKKMSLVNIEGKLTKDEMENVMAGSTGRNCFLMGVGIGFMGAASAIGGGVGMLFAGGAIGGFYSAASSNCF
ncbi:hypothetical protein [Flavobacterium sp. HBTb2-11-1]|uniref:hypothetical protein n=1 Tax=Flavobacterium sp. HBTb2-11-1 TaxID=2692212 RepID=UPI00136B1882|nr:hypothetical protein [Flavobacterium sp. HBTb2-11-1]MXO06549.1 hypothetical protein [Flavobacterium sp. HBTb2-11-1]